jgi:hypothetical protein
VLAALNFRRSQEERLPIAYELDRGRNIIIETWTGRITASDLAAYWRGYLLDPEVMRCRRTLVDLRDADVEFTGAELNQLIRTIALPAIGDRKWATAILVNAPAPYGVSRQYQVFAERYSHDSIFDDGERAVNWLLQQDPDALEAR